MVDPIVIASGFSLIRWLLASAVEAAETEGIPLEQVDEVYAEITTERKKKKADDLIDV